MAKSVPGGFYAGLLIVLIIGLFLSWSWQSERQVSGHTNDLLRAIEHKKWSRVNDLIAGEYTDQWGDDRTLMLERLREAFRYVRDVKIRFANPSITTEHRRGIWRAKITIDADSGEVGAMVEQRVNSLNTPFELEWRGASGKPWDWKLLHVSNSELELETGFD
jgi:hypothetical protein